MPTTTIKENINIEAALKAFLQALSELRELKVITNKKDFTCQVGEWLVAMLFGGERAISGIQKDWDIKVGEKYIQVKAHAKASTTKAKWSAIKYSSDAQIDELVIVVFTHDYKLKSFYKIPWSIALKRIKRNKDRDVIYWEHQKDFEIEIDNLPKQDLVRLFR